VKPVILRFGRLLCVCAMLFSATSVHARSVSPLEGLEALRKGFLVTNDFTADISQEKRLSLMKRSMLMTGTVRFRKPDLFYMEINPPFASRMLLRDSVIEQAGSRGGEHSRIALPPDQGLKQWISRLTAPLTSLPEEVAMRADLSAGLYTLTITPSGKGQVRELVISFQEDGTIRRLVITEQNGDQATMTFKKVRRNVGLGEKDFRLE
jgi:outer membrane lipoprotein carrier protein